MAGRDRDTEPGQQAREARTVVYVIASMITGGTQTHLLQVFRFLDRTRYRPVLFCLRSGGNLLPAVREHGVEVFEFGMAGSLRNPRDVAGLLRMRGVLRRLRPALVHGYLLRGNFYAAVAAKLAGVAAVVTSKRGLHEPTGWAERFAVRASNRISAVVTGNSPAVLEFTERIEGLPEQRMEMIPSGIDSERFDPDAVAAIRRELGVEARLVIGTAITLRPRKGYAMLFRVFAEIRRSFPTAVLAIAGVDRHNDETAALAARLGIDGDIVLLGKRADMPEVLASFDVFVLPSESEGMSNAVLEAMAMRLPVVATDTGGNRLVVGDGEAGYIVQYEDDAAMVERLSALLQDADLRARMGEIGRSRVLESYNAPAMVRSMQALYDRLLAGVAPLR